MTHLPLRGGITLILKLRGIAPGAYVADGGIRVGLPGADLPQHTAFWALSLSHHRRQAGAALASPSWHRRALRHCAATKTPKGHF